METETVLSVASIVTSPSMAYASTPFWCQVTQSLWYSDLYGKQVIRFFTVTESYDKMEFDQQVAFVIPTAFTTTKSTVLFVGLEDKIVEVDWQTKSIVREVFKFAENERLVSGKCSPMGTLFVSVVDATKSGDPGHLYGLREGPDGWKLTKLFGALWNEVFFQIPFGMAWYSKNEFFMVDSAFSTISKYYITGDHYDEPGALDFLNVWNDSYYVKKINTMKILSMADNLKYKLEGMTIDREKKLWVCITGAGCVLRIDPVTGQEVQRIFMPVPNPTGIVFGKISPLLALSYVCSYGLEI
jgi:gluconolactonase